MISKNAIAALLAACALSLSAFAAVASADVTIAEPGEGAGQVSFPAALAVDHELSRLYVADVGNRRIDVFDADTGEFMMAWGWGVADGSLEPQACGPAATPPTASCQMGLAGVGAGQFRRPVDLAVDNDPASPSHHAVYVVDTDSGFQNRNVRIQKFDSDGDFLLAFGAGVVTGGAAGAGNLSAGSTVVTNVVTTLKAFQVGQTITGAGIPAATRITALGNKTLTLSKPATASGSGVPITVAEGAGNVPTNEVQRLRFNNPPFAGKSFNVEVTTPAPDGSGARTGAEGEGLLHPESTSVTGVTTSAGTFLPGEFIYCCGGSGPTRPFKNPDYKIASFNPGTGAMTLSEATNPVVPNSKVELLAQVPVDTTAAYLQNVLEALPNISPGDIEVTESVGGGAPFLIEFKGPRFSDTDIPTIVNRSGTPQATSTPQNGSASAEVCTAAEAASCTGGVEGTGEGQFAQEVHVAVGPGGVVYVADSTEVLHEPSSGLRSFENRVQTFEPDGAFIEEFSLPEEDDSVRAVAVEADGKFQVATAPSIRQYDSDGSLLRTVSAVFPGALQVDPLGHLFSAEQDAGFLTVTERDSTGDVQRRFAYGQGASGLAPYQSATGDVFATIAGTVRHLAYPPPGPILAPKACTASPVGNTRATLRAQVNPAGKTTTFHFEYVDQESFEAEGFGGPNTIVSPESGSIGADHAMHDATQQVDVLPETTYHCRVVAKNEDQEGVTGQGGTFTTLPPFEIVASWVSGVSSDGATLNASVNPLGSPVSGYFEYVDEDTYQQSGFADAERAPAPPGELDFGAGENPKNASVELAGLKPNTRYRIRLAVDAHVIPIRYGDTQSFRTRRAGEVEVPDGRSYELVSADDASDAEIATPTAAGGGAEGIRAVAPSGEAVAFASFTAFADPEAAPTPSQYIARRGASGWSTTNLNLPGRVIRYGIPQQGFTPDLGFTAALLYEPPLTPACAAGYENLYWRNTQSGEVVCITAETPQSSAKFCPVFAGSSVDGSQVYFAANASLAGAPKGNGWSLYRWSGGEVSLVSVLPNGNSALPRSSTGFGAATNGEGFCNAMGDLGGAVSEDGNRAFWHYGTEYAGSPEPLFAATVGAATVQLDAVQGGAGPGGKGTFRGASADGSLAFFTAPGQLTAGASGGADLYRYDFGSAPGSRLENLTPGALTPGSEAAAVRGVLATSADGTRAYFAADGVLTGSQANGTGEVAQPGEPNLYLWEQGEGVRFLGTLGPGDASNWEPDARNRSTSASPSASHLAFVSVRSLTGYDNTDPATDLPRRQVFLYSAATDQLSCASCNPTGEQPTGEASLPGWTNPVAGSRYLSEDGNRLFFQSRDDLLAADENGEQDVYEFERPGTGTCSAQSGAYVEDAGGCLYLISGGRNDDASYLLGASSQGRDVFFSTRERLLLSDQDERYDVYDYRVGGFPPPSPPPPACQGEACRPPVSSSPPGASPSTSSFVGPGNEVSKQCPRGKVLRKGKCVPRPCPKGKVRRKGKCVPKKRGKHRASKGKSGKHRSANDRRAAR